LLKPALDRRSRRPVRILGVDPGSRITGAGVIDVVNGELRPVASQSIRLGQGDINGRLALLYTQLSGMIEEHQPDVVAVERVFVARNAKSALVLGHARGAAILAAALRELPIAEYSAREIKLAVVGKGTAEKSQVQHMIRVLLGMTKAPATDASDALACAICHAHHSALQDKLSTASVGA
jgi:crossover junction endodeoxyribonuclease RuvC